MGRLVLYAGRSNPALAQEIASHLERPLSRAAIESFPDGETKIRLEESVRGSDVFIIQSTCPPVNENLMELLLMIDAARRASAQRLTAVIPYYGYARQDKKLTGREPISAKLVANLISTAGADRVLTMDLHAPTIEGFFDIPVDHLRSVPLMADCFRDLPPSDLVIVSPDVGGAKRANKLRHFLGTEASLAMVFKERLKGSGSPEILGIVGEVEGKTAVIIDDIIATGETILKTVDLLAEKGAKAIYACAIHPILAPGAIERVDSSPVTKLVVTNTVPLPSDRQSDKIEVVSMAPLLATAIMYIHKGLSMTTLFKEVEEKRRVKSEPA
ncbi:MAG: ribose-phosphate pyrophosphokinase [Chloroflexota bacterium]|nr:ribose-phosphate pyrophosphokinase [Chloroflexota bacterium]